MNRTRYTEWNELHNLCFGLEHVWRWAKVGMHAWQWHSSDMSVSKSIMGGREKYGVWVLEHAAWIMEIGRTGIHVIKYRKPMKEPTIREVMTFDLFSFFHFMKLNYVSKLPLPLLAGMSSTIHASFNSCIFPFLCSILEGGIHL